MHDDLMQTLEWLELDNVSGVCFDDEGDGLEAVFDDVKKDIWRLVDVGTDDGYVEKFLLEFCELFF